MPLSECRCNPYGSLNTVCDKRRGQCVCRANVTGRACDRCAEGFWNLQSASGCEKCECNPVGSADSNCSSFTGRCNCKPGVGGPNCDACLEGFYGFSVGGCKGE